MVRITIAGVQNQDAFNRKEKPMGTGEEVSGKEVPQWHVSVGETPKGPLTLAEVVELSNQGKITATSLAWRKGMSDWLAISQIPELRSLVFGDSPPVASSAQPQPTPNALLRRMLGDAGAEQITMWLLPYWERTKNTLGSDAFSQVAKQYARTHQFQGVSRSSAVKYIIQFANLNGYTIQDIRESEGLLTLMKGRATFPIVCRETGNDATTVEVNIKAFMAGHFPKKRMVNECFEGMKSTILSIQHGVPATPIVQPGQTQPSGNAAFLQGMNQGCGCLLAVALVLFLLFLLGSWNLEQMAK